MKYFNYLLLLLTYFYIKCDAIDSVNPIQLRHDLDLLKITVQFELNMLRAQCHQELNKTMVGMNNDIDSLVNLLSHIDPKTPDGKLQLQNLESARLGLIPKIEAELLIVHDKIAKMQQSISMQLALDVTQLETDLLALEQKVKTADISKLVLVSLPVLAMLKQNVTQYIQQVGIELQKLP
ncbi:uncharacterized protein LOC128952411 [Oppia nitens]|uniref:uncharacterized protein LOC128952411 n=1 Tax=Oppia nitens TaxID=1686743 RepID=UPI0023DA39C3|nr:uncharacterized protein LOC128952411 [Oppia nitens]